MGKDTISPIEHRLNLRLLSRVQQKARTRRYVWLLQCGHGHLLGTRSEQITRLCEIHRLLRAGSTSQLELAVRLVQSGEVPGELYEVTERGLCLVRSADLPEYVSQAFYRALMGGV